MVTHTQRKRQTLTSTDSLPNGHNIGLGQNKTTSEEIPHRWQGPRHTGHSLLPSHAHEQEAAPKDEYPALGSI